MVLKPWYTVVTPREDLRQQRPLDAAEFAVHLDQVRDGRAPTVYQNPDAFFDRTYLTRKLTELGIEVVRRLSGEVNEASAVFNLATQFGGGKTHALTMLYHLAEYGQEATRWRGVAQIVEAAHVPFVPKARTAVFVGQQFDSIRGRGGNDGTPLRKTPWGEIAYQLGGDAAFAVVAEHDERGIAPGGDVIREMIPADIPCLILMDEVMNYINHSRRLGLSGQFYNFIQNLSEEARSRRGVALVVSIPASELEMSTDDEHDYQSIKKVLDRLGKAVIISAEHETSEIIRRRLFEWNGVTDDARKTTNAYAEWVVEHSQQLAENWTREKAVEAFAASYPFHPSVLSVFERKWQALPRFQRTRGVLQLLARWVAKAYAEGYSGAQRDPLIDLGTAPLDDPDFRAAVFEQLGEERLEAAVTTDIAGKFNSHAIGLDEAAQDTLKKARLHRKVASTIFFESNGGRTAQTEATIPEIRLSVGYPDLEIGNVDTVLEQLGEACYYLSIDHNRYKFSVRENLIKKHADYKANIAEQRIEERIEEEIRGVFDRTKAVHEVGANATLDVVFFPRSSGDVQHLPQITLVVLPPTDSIKDVSTIRRIEAWTREYGTQTRTFKNALIWCVADENNVLRENAKKTLAWEDIKQEGYSSDSIEAHDEIQRRQLDEYVMKSGRDLREGVWRTYRNIVLLARDGSLKTVNLGLVHSSAASTPINVIINHLMQQGDVEIGIGYNFLLRNWPPALVEWDTRSVKNAFFASAQFPRLLNPSTIRDTIAKGVADGYLAYVSSSEDDYIVFRYHEAITSAEIDLFSGDMCIIKGETAETYRQRRNHSIIDDQHINPEVENDTITDLSNNASIKDFVDEDEEPSVLPSRVTAAIRWQGEIPAQKWSIFYNKILSRFAIGQSLRIIVQFDVKPPDGISAPKIEETKLSLRELGLDDSIESK